MMTARIVQIVIGIVGLGALTLGLLFWVANIDLLNIHMFLGLIVALTLLVMGFIAICTRGMRLWGIIGIPYAVIVPIFGLTQSGLLVGGLHWLVQTGHLLVGVGAMVLAGMIVARRMALKRTIGVLTPESQAVR